MKEHSLDVAFTARELAHRDLEGVGVVVVDILRATTTLTAALAAGALGIWPVADPEEARSLGRILSALVGGERGGLPLPGFDLGNSPMEYTREVVGGRPIVLTTSNGTMTLGNSVGGQWVIAGCFNNLSAVAARLQRWPEGPVIIACAGTDGGKRESEEDLLFAGELTDRLMQMEGSRWHLEEGACAACDYSARRRGPVREALREMPHARELVRLGLGDDVIWAGRMNTLDTVGVMVEDASGRPCIKVPGEGAHG